MYASIRRLGCVFLCLALVFSMAGCGEDASLSSGSSAGQRLSADQLTAAQQDFIQAHLNYINGLNYQQVLSSPGGLSVQLADQIRKNHMDIGYGFWTALNTATSILTEGEVETQDPYKLAVAELMQSTASTKFFSGSMKLGYQEAALVALQQICATLEASKDTTDLLTEDGIKKAEKVIDYLQTILQGPVPLDDDILNEAMAEVRSLYTSTYIKDHEAFFSDVKLNLTVGLEGSRFVSETLDDLMFEVCFYQAVDSASAEWEASWQQIAAQARKSKYPEGKKIALYIEELLKDMESYRQDSAAALCRSLIDSAGHNGLETIASIGFELIDDALDAHPVIGPLRDGLAAGVGISNRLTATDDISHYGRLLLSYGCLSQAAYTVMKDAGQTLKNDPCYEAALLFEQTFEIYKSIQLSSIDCAIGYTQIVVSAPAAYLFTGKTEDLRQELTQMTAYRSEWADRYCHVADTVLNNGGEVVGYRGNIYYIRYSADAIAEGGHVADFPRNSEAVNQLVCRDAQGKETVLLQAAVYGNLYICNQRVVYQVHEKGWYHCNLQGEDPKPLGGSPVSVYSDASSIVLRSGSRLSATDLADETSGAIHIPQEATAAGGYNETVYYYLWDQDYAAGRVTCTFYRADMSQGTVTQADDLTIDYHYELPVFTDFAVTANGFYALIGFVDGRAGFFQNGSIYYLPADGDTVQTPVDGEVSVSFMYLRQAEDDRYCLYYDNMGGDDSIEPVLYNNFFTGNTQCLDLQTGDITGTGLPLCEEKAPFILDGDLYMLDGESDEPTLLVTDAMVRQAGFGPWGRHDGGATYCLSADLVGSVCYVTIMDAVSDANYTADSYYTGSYPGYTWKAIRFYAVDLKTGDMTEIYSY